jgi:hypothetical protein
MIEAGPDILLARIPLTPPYPSSIKSKQQRIQTHILPQHKNMIQAFIFDMDGR